MHFEMSISFATSSVSRTLGDGLVVAERRVMSSDWRVDMPAAP
jgi:hypothetical protein